MTTARAASAAPLPPRLRIACVVLCDLAMRRWLARADDPPPEAEPLALSFDGPHGARLHALNAAAARLGLRAGQPVTDARAICPALHLRDADPGADSADLNRLALWARRWGPLATTDGTDGLFVDTSGVAHLFGGEERLARDMAARLAALGLPARVAIAPTPGAAHALARFAAGTGPWLSHAAAADCAPLPVQCLRLDPDTVQLLRRLGLKTVADLVVIPPRSFARRFRAAGVADADPLCRLGQLTGAVAEPLDGVDDPGRPRALVRMEEPVLHVATLLPLLAHLAAELVAELDRRNWGARRLAFEGFRLDGTVARLEAETVRPMNDAAHMVRLLTERVEELDAGFGFDALALTALWCEPLARAQGGLWQTGDEGVAFGRLIDRLADRLGANAVRAPAVVDSHWPERAAGWTRASGMVPVPLAPPVGPPRPLRLLDRPERIAVLYATPEGAPRRFVWRGVQRLVARAEGPERIAPEWWRERSTARARDYYRVEDEAGGRYWIYRDGLLGDGRGGNRVGDAPDWFLHGLFG